MSYSVKQHKPELLVEQESYKPTFNHVWSPALLCHLSNAQSSGYEALS